MAVVHCSHSQGLVLRLYEMVKDGAGIEHSRPKGSPVELRPGRNEVDDAFIAAWRERHKDDEIITRGIVHIEPSVPPTGS